MKKIGSLFVAIGILWILATTAIAQTETTQPEQSQPPEQVQQLEDMVVKEKTGAAGLEQKPSKIVIDLDRRPTIAVPDSIVDVLKGYAIIDFRGESDIDPGVDSIYLRGFDAKRFVTALDGLTVQKTGGRKSSNIVDYALLPAFLVDTVEILPGPHSALYDCKSIGGVLNLKSAKPKRRDSLKPDVKATVSYASYDTQSQQVTAQGAVQAVTYDLAYKHSASDGYLRNNASDIETVYGRLGLILPADGFITLSASYSDVDREAPVTNTGDDYDDGYPEVEDASFAPWQKPTWNGLSYNYRLNYEQNTPIGRLSFGAYTGWDNRDRSYYENIGDAEPATMDTDWWQQGGKVQDEITWSDKHITTVGFDMVQLYDDGVDDEKTERINKKGGFLQHQWAVLPSVDVRLGLRYEDVCIKVTNNGRITGRPDIIERNWDQLVPKSFITWKMDQVAPWLRDTSLSAGISKIWHAPDYHGTYNPQGRPAGAWLEPEHGMGYDLVLDRRLWGDISFQLAYSFYDIEDFFAYNRQYSQYTPSRSNPVTPGLEYKDYVINLDRVHRHGIDVGISGHLSQPLSFYLTYAWQKFSNQGDEPAGETELHKRAEHRVTAGLAYQLFEDTTLMLDYYYQSREITENAEEIAEDEWFFTETENAPYNVFDIGVQQVLFKSDRLLHKATLRVYVQNLFDEEYSNASGYPATDRTYGAALTLNF